MGARDCDPRRSVAAHIWGEEARMKRSFLPWLICFCLFTSPGLESVSVLLAQERPAPARARSGRRGVPAPADGRASQQQQRQQPQQPSGSSRARQHPGRTPQEQIAYYTKQIESTDGAERAKGYTLRGKAHYDARQYDKAIADLLESLRLAPGNSTTYMFLGFCYQATDKPLDAKLAAAWSELYRGQPDKAIRAFDEAIRMDPHSAVAYAGRGKARLRWSQVDAGLDDLARAIEIDPRYGEAYLTRAEHYAKAGEGKLALADLDAAIRAGSKDAEVFVRRGMARVALGQFDGGIEDLTQVLARQPNHTGALYRRGVAFTMVRQHHKAIADFDKLIQVKPNYPAAHTARALAKLAREDFAGAAADCDEAIRLNRHDADAHFMRGRLHLRQPDEAQARLDAVAHITRAVRLDPALAKPALAELEPLLQRRPDFTSALHARGVARYQMGDYEAALEDLNRIVADPHVPTAMMYYDRGMAYYQQKQYDSAARNFDWCIERDPHLDAARLARGQVDFVRGNYEAARKHFQDVAFRNRDDLQANKHLAMAEHRAGRSDYAMETLRRMSSMQAGAAQDPEPYYLKGVILAERGDFPAAAAEMESAVRFDPTNDLYRKTLKEFQGRRRGGRGSEAGMSSEEFGAFLVAGVAFILVANAMTGDDRPPPSASLPVDHFPFQQKSLLDAAVEAGVIKTGTLPF